MTTQASSACCLFYRRVLLSSMILIINSRRILRIRRPGVYLRRPCSQGRPSRLYLLFHSAIFSAGKEHSHPASHLHALPPVKAKCESSETGTRLLLAHQLLAPSDAGS